MIISDSLLIYCDVLWLASNFLQVIQKKVDGATTQVKWFITAKLIIDFKTRKEPLVIPKQSTAMISFLIKFNYFSIFDRWTLWNLITI